MLILAVRTTVYPEQQWNPGPLHIANRVSQQAVHLRAVFALEADLFGRGDFKLSKQRIILMCELTQRAALHCIDLGMSCIATGKNRGTPATRSPTGHCDRRRHQSFDAARAQVHPRW